MSLLWNQRQHSKKRQRSVGLFLFLLILFSCTFLISGISAKEEEKEDADIDASYDSNNKHNDDDNDNRENINLNVDQKETAEAYDDDNEEEDDDDDVEMEPIPISFGVPQEIWEFNKIEITFKIIDRTEKYIQNVVMAPENSHIYNDHSRENCKVWDPYCSQWAATSQCIENPKFMHEACPAACQTCHLLHLPLEDIDESSSPVVGLTDMKIVKLWEEIQASVEFSLVPNKNHSNRPRRQRAASKLRKRQELWGGAMATAFSLSDKSSRYKLVSQRENNNNNKEDYVEDLLAELQEEDEEEEDLEDEEEEVPNEEEAHDDEYNYDDADEDEEEDPNRRKPVKVSYGVPQEFWGNHGVECITQIIKQTDEYIRDTVMAMENYFLIYDDYSRKNCKVNDKFCSYWAASGQCVENPQFMHETCPAVCQTCHLLNVPLSDIDEESSPVEGFFGMEVVKIREEIQATVEFSLIPKILDRPRRQRVPHKQGRVAAEDAAAVATTFALMGTSSRYQEMSNRLRKSRFLDIDD